jgi:hypothetical protein
VLSAAFETDDLEAALTQVQKLGAAPIAGPVTTTLPGLGKLRLATVTAPDGECLEFFQRND